MDTQRGYCFRMTAERMNHFTMLLEFPDENMPEIGRGNEILEFFRNDQVCDIIFIG